jgi:hypothetical protein
VNPHAQRPIFRAIAAHFYPPSQHPHNLHAPG